MSNRRWQLFGPLMLLVLGVGLHLTFAQETPRPVRPDRVTTDAAAVEKPVPRVALAVARDRAELLHTTHLETLAAMHHRYFHGERAIVPARVMEDVFANLEKQTHIKAQWISASLSPMSINHEPQTEFEKHAARQLAKGTTYVETIEDGYYRRAGSVSLGGGCTSCHAGLFASTSTTPKFAGLIISIPVQPDARLPDVTPAPSR